MPELVQAPTSARGYILVPLPCGHHNARLASSELVTRQCRTCRAYYLIEYLSGDVAKVTGVTCSSCGGLLHWEGDCWYCTRCGDEWDDTVVSNRPT